MRTSVRPPALTLGAIAIAAACHSAPPPPPPVIAPLSDSASAALQWVQANAVPIAVGDSSAPGADAARLAALAGDARIIGISELTEGTHQFPSVVQRALFALADADGIRGVAVQVPMAEAMEVDRFVRTGNGDPKRLLHALGSWRWETPEMLALVESLRDRNRGRSAERQIGFYGFEIPTAAHAVAVVNSLPDSIAGAPLKAWFRREYGCVLSDEAARFGREGRASDSAFWRRCGTVATAAVDSIVALRARVGAVRSAQIAFVEEMARLVQHHVMTGLQYLTRQDANAEHVLYLANSLGPDAKLLVWGGDVEMGRLALDSATVQTGLSLGKKLGEKYRAIAFLVGDGTLRARPGAFGRNGQPTDPTTVTLAPPRPGTFEEVFSRVSLGAYFVDMRSLPADVAGAWLRGPRPARLISEVYAAPAAQLFQTPLEFPKFFDAVAFVRHVTAVR
ncbi:MAG TPA: erythromycin esterase family protein [Gemmatimonadaceae bacterium]